MYTTGRVFDWKSHHEFARASGDSNPIHVDVVAARRTLSGAPIVHGVHSLIWVLDSFAESAFFRSGAKSLKAQFLQPIYVGDEVTLEICEPAPTIVRARVLAGSEEVLVVHVGFDAAPRTLPPRLPHALRVTPPPAPNDLSLEEMEGFRGCLSFAPATSDIGTLFPSAVAAFGMPRIAALACSSCLVGMVVPGLHSMFSGLEISICEDDPAPADGLRFSVQSVAKRFRLIRIGIDGSGVRGWLETVSRMPPVRQPSISRILTLVSQDEFRNSTALVIGGSRGLGELTGKLIAAGGGQVIITYAIGKTDADAVVADIRNAGYKCAALPYDVHRPAAEQLAALDVAPTHLYYFATPPIFRRKSGIFDSRRFAEFSLFYVHAFYDLVHACAHRRPDGIRVFYPSSSALEARPANMTEYSMSKAAAEILCADLSKFAPGVHVMTRRLPRLPTDQTNSVVEVQTVDPVTLMLDIVREMQV